MTVIARIRTYLKVAAWIIMVPLLVVAVLLMLVYSPWSQNYMRQYAVQTLQRQGIEARIDSFALHFPLSVELRGVRLDMPGPQIISASKLQAKVGVVPLLAGQASLSDISLTDGQFRLGAPDSAMLLTVSGRTIAIDRARVGLAKLDIDADNARLSGGRVSLTLNQWVPTDSTPSSKDKTDMKIKVKSLALSNMSYRMRMLPTIDSLGAEIPCGRVEGFELDLLRQCIHIQSFVGQRLAASYIAPDSATIAATPPIPPSTSSSEEWTVRIDTIGFTQSRGLYTTRGVTPLPGLDFAYIQADSMTLGVKNFYNRGTVVRVPISLEGTERSGVALRAQGKLNVDSLATRLDSFSITTPRGTTLAASMLIGMGDLLTEPSTPFGVKADGQIAAADMALMFPPMAPMLAAMGRNAKIDAGTAMSGTAGRLNVENLNVAIPGMAYLDARGTVLNAFNPAAIGGRIALQGEIIDIDRIKPMLMSRTTAAQVNIPRTRLEGNVNMLGGKIDGKLKAVTDGGDIALDADWNSRLENYDLKVAAKHFPVRSFMPLLGVGRVSATLTAKGHGYNPMSPKTSIDVTAAVDRAEYGKYTYGNIKGSAALHAGQAQLSLNSNDPNARFTLDASGNLAGQAYTWQARLDGTHIDLKALGLSADDAEIAAVLTADATVQPSHRAIDGNLKLQSLSYRDKITTTRLSNIIAALQATDSVTTLTLDNRDLHGRLVSRTSLDSIMTRLDQTSGILAQQFRLMKVNVDTLQRALPKFELELNAGPDNMLTDLMAESRSRFGNLRVTASNNTSLSLRADMLRYASPSMKLDTVSFDLAQYEDRLVFDGRIENAPGTFDEWAHVSVAGFIFENRLGMRLNQLNIKNEEGYNIGLDAVVADSTVTLSVNPVDPTIAYMPWSVNEDNFIKYSFSHHHLDANLHMKSAKSSLAVYTDHVEGTDGQEEIVVDMNDIDIADWIRINPFAPGYSGRLSADMKVSYKDSNINGHGTVTLADFTYDRRRVGTLRSDLEISTDLAGKLRAHAGLFVDGRKAIDVSGAVNDSTAGSPLAMQMSLTSFPLSIANPFMPQGVMSMRGTLNGQMAVSGTGLEPHLDGWVQFDSAAVRVAMTATEYKFNDVRIPVEDNVVQFNNFAVSGTNSNPLTVSGTVDAHSFVNPKVDLRFNAQNMQIVNSNRAARGATVYGRANINLGATVRGDMKFMAVNTNVSVLPGTNITYVMADAATVISQQQNSNMVKFVNFADTVQVTQADSLEQSGMAMMVTATLDLQTGTTVNVDLNSNGRDKVSVQPNGTLDFSMMPFSQPRLTGRINLPKGFARYTPPLLTEKNFELQPDSYVAFNGDIMNPTLNVVAVDVMRANVTQTGQNSRMVNFDVTLSVTGTLENMNVAFDLGTDDDITVANELQSMSASQRASQAMNMLLYNVYSGPGTTANSNLSGNMLYSFLASQINNWAAGAIKGVDLTFGVDQYDRTVGDNTSQTTSYSYQVSKSLFNDRFKIVVGGNYSTDAGTDENLSQNLIKDISFEYFLNRAQTMYVRLFRHTGYESILEGEITKTGVGFVYKRKSNSLRGLLGLRRHHRQTTNEVNGN